MSYWLFGIGARAWVLKGFRYLNGRGYTEARSSWRRSAECGGPQGWPYGY